MSRLRLAISTLLTAAVLAGCGGMQTDEQDRRASPEIAARTLLDEAEYAAAASEWLRLALNASGEQALRYRVWAASALLQQGDAQGAGELLAQTAPSPRDVALRGRIAVLQAWLLALNGEPEQALERLPAGLGATLDEDTRVDFRLARAAALGALGRPFESAAERVALELELTGSGRITRNREALWSTLQPVSVPVLSQFGALPPDTLGGWVELALIVKLQLFEPPALQQSLRDWRQRYPGHPAGERVLPALLEQSRAESQPARHVALLLPLSGPFARAAEAVRDGFLAAWYADSELAERPVVSVYDSGSEDVRTVYDRAVQAGADFVVGPLAKEQVSALAEADSLPVPTLALNQIDEPAFEAKPVARDLFQFALAPEAEARQVAEQAWFDGYQAVAVIVPEGRWGERVSGAFISTWETLGGVVASFERYEPDARDMSQPVMQLLRVDASERRAKELRRTLGERFEFEPRRRQDIDFIFMGAFPVQARQLRPQFQFHHAADLPIYATSHVYAGTPTPSADRDVDGVRFNDVPWVLEADGENARVRERLAGLWPEAVPALLRLQAFGWDAYSLVSRVRRLGWQGSEYPGATGRLSVDAGNRVRRRLMWASFTNGEPRPLQPVSPPMP